MTRAPEILLLRSAIAVEAELARAVLVAVTPTTTAARVATTGIDFFMCSSPLGLQPGGGHHPLAAETDDALPAGLARGGITREGGERPGCVGDLLRAAAACDDTELAGHAGASSRGSACTEGWRAAVRACAAAAHDLAAALGQEVIEGAALCVGEDGAEPGVLRGDYACGCDRRRCWRRRARTRGSGWRRRGRRSRGRAAV